MISALEISLIFSNTGIAISLLNWGQRLHFASHAINNYTKKESRSSLFLDLINDAQFVCLLSLSPQVPLAPMVLVYPLNLTVKFHQLILPL